MGSYTVIGTRNKIKTSGILFLKRHTESCLQYKISSYKDNDLQTTDHELEVSKETETAGKPVGKIQAAVLSTQVSSHFLCLGWKHPPQAATAVHFLQLSSARGTRSDGAFGRW